MPYQFQARDLGSSKLNLKEQWHYVLHLLRLVQSSEEDLKFWKFCLVGSSGVIVNMLVYLPLVSMGVYIGFAYALATVTAMLNNFIWNNLFTWTHLKHDRLWYRMVKFFTVSLSGLAISSAAVITGNQWLGLHEALSGLLGIGISTGWNFLLNNRWTFARGKDRIESGANATQAES
jgi:dolichol-phosphate mannosyltransferase